MLASVASNVASQSQVSKSQLATLTDAHQAATHRNMLDESQEPNHGICELTRAGAKSCVSQTSQELSATCPAASDMLGATTAHQILALGAQSGIRRLSRLQRSMEEMIMQVEPESIADTSRCGPRIDLETMTDLILNGSHGETHQVEILLQDDLASLAMWLNDDDGATGASDDDA
jgi:hypothetical protein